MIESASKVSHLRVGDVGSPDVINMKDVTIPVDPATVTLEECEKSANLFEGCAAFPGSKAISNGKYI